MTLENKAGYLRYNNWAPKWNDVSRAIDSCDAAPLWKGREQASVGACHPAEGGSGWMCEERKERGRFNATKTRQLRGEEKHGSEALLFQEVVAGKMI